MADAEDGTIPGTADGPAGPGPAASPHLKTKSALVDEIRSAMRAQGITQTQAAKVIGLNKSEMSRLLNGKHHLFSVHRLLRALINLDMEVVITVRPRGAMGGKRIKLV